MYTYMNKRNHKEFTALYPTDSQLKAVLSLKSKDIIIVFNEAGEWVSTLRYQFGKTVRID